MQQLADILNASPEISESARKRVPLGIPDKRISSSHYKVNNEKATKILGIESPSLDETIVQLVQQLLKFESVV